MRIIWNFLIRNKNTFLFCAVLGLAFLSMKLFFERREANKQVISITKELKIEKHKTDSLQTLFYKVANQPACNYSVTFEIKNTAVMGKVSNIDVKPISEAVMTVLKKDLLDGNIENKEFKTVH